ncbi:STAS domain-containing protein [Streptomyces cyaneofuscatus]|uniref:STAS domain-containing protein n=1 Tax=Streptomyces cyaneofuscatus TaxID=66883 RepID=UPI00332B2308
MSHNESAPRTLPVIAARGDLDAHTLGPLSADLQAAAEAHSGVVLDASDVSFGDSTFLNLLLRVHQQTDLRIAAPSHAVRRLLSITGADSVLRVHGSVGEAQEQSADA